MGCLRYLILCIFENMEFIHTKQVRYCYFCVSFRFLFNESSSVEVDVKDG